MKTETWKKIATACGILGLVGGAGTLAANAIHLSKPGTSNLPADHVKEIKRLALEAMKESQEKKS